MSLDELLAKDIGVVKKDVMEDVSKERVVRDMPRLRQLVAFWRVYPDLFVDWLCSLNPNNTFHFFFYQRV